MAKEESSGSKRRREIDLLQKKKRERKALRKLLGLDVVPNDPNSLYDPRLSYGFSVDYSTCPYTRVESTWGDDYDIALYGRLGLHCYNFLKGTNFKFVRWEKFGFNSTAHFDFHYVTLEAKDPASDSDLSFQTLLSDDSYAASSIVRWTTLACRIKCNEAVHNDWDDTAIDDFYKGAVPKCLSDEELACDNRKYYVVQESELQENEWLLLFTEIAFYSKAEQGLTAPPPLEIEKVVVETKEDTAEAREKLKAKNAIFYVSYKYNGDSSSWARDHNAIIRRTMDGKPGHMCLEVWN